MEPVKFRTARMETGQLIIDIPPEERGGVMAWLKNRKDRDYSLTIKEHRERRSKDANAYAWCLLGELAKVMHIKPEDVYRQYVHDLGGNYTVCTVLETEVDRLINSWRQHGIGWIAEPLGPAGQWGKTNVICYHGSSVYDSATMSRLIDNIVQDCKALGIETLTPDKLSLLKEEWQ